MKILISNESQFNAHFYERLGLTRALSYSKHEVCLWDCSNKPALDIFSEFEPDIFIGQSYNLNRALIKAIKARPNLKVCLKAGDSGPANEEWDSKTYPVLLANKQEHDNVSQIVDQIDFLFIHYHPDYISETHGYWTKFQGIPVISLMNAADIFDYTNGQFCPELESDISFVGGRWGYKSANMDQYLIKLCNPTLGLNIKIFGNTDWGIPQYYGFVPNEIVKHIFSSAKICPSISEPHSVKFGWDLIERPFKLLSNRCFIICDNVAGFRKLIPNGMVYAENPQDFIEKVFYYLKNPDEKQKYIDRGYQTVIDNNTYFDRGWSIFNQLGFKKEAEEISHYKRLAMRELNLL